MGTFTQSSIIVQNIFLTVDPTLYFVDQRDDVFVVERDGTQVITSFGYPIPTDSDVDVTDWMLQVFRSGGSVSSDRQVLVNALVTGLKSDGVWSKLDRLWLLAAENYQSALVDLVVNGIASMVASPTFTVDRGFAGNGTSSYLNTNYNPSVNGVNYTLNAAHLSVWDNTNRTSPASSVAVGDVRSYIHPYKVGGGNQMVEVINTTAEWGGADRGTSLGYHVASRTGASATGIYYNGVFDQTSPAGATTLSSDMFYICARKGASGADDLSTDQISAVSAGGALTGTDATNLYNRLRTYMTAVGVP